jgi:hypothetical protein
LKDDGTVVAWGDNSDGQVTGTPATNDSPFAVASPVTLNGQVLSGVTSVAAAGVHSFALAGMGLTMAVKNDGTVAAWGNNSWGQVTGTPTAPEPSPIEWYGSVASPITLGGRVLSAVTAIAAGGYHTVALLGTAPLRPSLQIQSNGNQVILSWAANATGFTLQSTLDLVTPVTWTDYSSPYALIGTRFMLTNSAPDAARYFRLLEQ